MIDSRNSRPSTLRLRFFTAGLFLAALMPTLPATSGAEPANSNGKKKIVLIAGKKSHGPEGNGIHDYPWSVKLLKVMLDNSNVHDKARVEYHLDGWPANESTLEDADAIMIISDGRDGELYEEAPHFSTDEHTAMIAKQIARGCGFLTFHFSTFAPDARAKEILDWTGGYFDWETDGKRQWYSAITTQEANVEPATPDHPVLRGVKSFKMKEEFYHNIRFADDAQKTIPLWKVPFLPGRDASGTVVAWARERANGGRGFGTTCGHFYENWKEENFRRMILNAIVWSAGIEVPAGGVQSRFYTHAEITAALAGKDGTERAVVDDQPIRVLLFAGNDAHKWHNWEKTTPAIVEALKRDQRIQVEVSHDFEDLARKKLDDFDVIIQNNYANWQDPRALSDAAKTAFVNFLQSGHGLVVIHFANGAFHFSLPNAGASDWPEYRKIVRRVWNHHGEDAMKSGHDAFGEFAVEPTSIESPIIHGLKSFRVNDELYFRQQGDEPIEPLLAAGSKVTGREEPLAWTYRYGKGRVFQTLLGHSERTYDVFEPREMLRRAVAWSAGRVVRELAPADDALPKPAVVAPKAPIVEGRFGKALDARVRYVEIEGRPKFRQAPLTVELWAKLPGKSSYNILIACDTKASANHWEIFTEPASGELCLYVPGCKPDHVRTGLQICDGRWHQITLALDVNRAQFIVDGKPTREAVIERVRTDGKPGNLAIGSLVERGIACDGFIDDVRISSGIIPQAAYNEPRKAESSTLGLWTFDSVIEGKVPDGSAHKNIGRLVDPMAPALPPQAFVPPDGLNCEAADPKMKVALIDRSVNDVFMAVKADGAGRLFVGGRESLFVFEPNPKGGFLPKQELFRFPQDSIIIGLEYRGDDLYVLTDNALYLIPEGRTKRDGLKPRRLLWGVPLDLHVSFHCLTWGPEGDLYLNHGDPLLNYGDFSRPDHWGHWTLYSADGNSLPYTGVGSVIRVHPDGSEPRIVCTGFRGPVGLAFDSRGNLFTNDNDHESMADRYAPARLIHAAPHSDFGWPRGWMASMSPERSDLLEPLNVNLGRGVPCDLAFYDDVMLPDDEQESLLLCRWDRFDVARYVLRRRGASFTAEEKPFLKARNNGRPVGVAVDGRRRVFVTMLYLAGNVATPHCYSDLVMVSGDENFPPIVSSDTVLPAIEHTTARSDVLWSELSSPLKERRVRAEVELRRRGTREWGSVLNRLRQTPPSDPALPHLIWLAGATGDSQTLRHIASLATSDIAAVREIAVRVLAQYSPSANSDAILTRRLEDKEPGIQLSAVSAFFDTRRAFPFEKLIPLAASDDDYLRQVTTRLLARRAELDQLKSLVSSSDPAHRLAGVLAAGLRLTVPGNHFLPPKDLKLSFPNENAFFKLTQNFADTDKGVDLRQLGRIGSFTTAELWKHQPPTDEQKELVELLKQGLNDDYSLAATQAHYWLSLLHDPAIEPVLEQSRLARLARELEAARPVAVNQAWTIGPFTVAEKEKPQTLLEQNAIDLTATYDAGEQKRAWELRKDEGSGFRIKSQSAVRSEAVEYLYFRVESSTRQNAKLTFNGADNLRAWNNSREVMDRLPAPADQDRQLVVDLQPGTNDLLLKFGMPMESSPVEIKVAAAKTITISIPDKLDSAMLVERLRDAQKANTGSIAAEFALADWANEVKKGDVARGRQLFGSIGCAKCHAIAANQKSGGGPSLAEARKRFTVAHVVESVLLPSRQVADAFRATTIVEASGAATTGLVVSESKEELEILLQDASRRKILRDQIEDLKISNLSPMPQGLVKTPAELRDLAAYLLSENPSPP